LEFVVKEGVDLRLGEEHFFVGVEKVYVNLLILSPFAQVIRQQTHNNLLPWVFDLLILWGFYIGQV
jgi:hypothetical protein